MKTNIVLMKEQLPPEAQFWLKTLTVSGRDEMERILKETGVENFTKYWREHKAELEELEHSFNMRV